MCLRAIVFWHLNQVKRDLFPTFLIQITQSLSLASHNWWFRVFKTSPENNASWSSTYSRVIWSTRIWFKSWISFDILLWRKWEWFGIINKQGVGSCWWNLAHGKFCFWKIHKVLHIHPPPVNSDAKLSHVIKRARFHTRPRGYRTLEILHRQKNLRSVKKILMDP